MYTDEYYFNNLNKFYDKNRRLPKFKDLTSANGLPAKQTIYRRFGGLDSFIRLSGIDFKELENTKPKVTYTRDMVLHAIKNFTIEHGRLPKLNEMKNKNGCPSSTVIYSLFDSWNETLRVFSDKMPSYYKSAKIRRVERVCGLSPQYQYLHQNIDYEKLINVLEYRKYKHLPYYKRLTLERQEVRKKKDYVYSLGLDIQVMNNIWLAYVRHGKGKDYYQ